MADNEPIIPEVLPPLKKKTGFQPGHPRYGGRKKGTPNKRTLLARDIAEKLKFDPIEVAVQVVVHGLMPTTQKDGSVVLVPVGVDERLKMLRDLTQYIQPKLTSVQVTGKDDGPVQVASLDVAQILMNPELADAAQKLALQMAQQEALAAAEDDDAD
jgi:hypothetical protein